MRSSTILTYTLLPATLAVPHHQHHHHKINTITVFTTVYCTPGDNTEANNAHMTASISLKSKEPEQALTPPNTDRAYMSAIDKWRAKLGLGTLAYDKDLEANAYICVIEGNGVMKHKLGIGSKGQVLAPGHQDKFEDVLLGGWLCEMPYLPSITAICAKLTREWAHNGQTGHAEIMTSHKYSRIGCAFFKGIWACDVA